ncbi:hypothetical protein LR48_Vigan04g111300 [Vigna angularis]|uniref:Uncharacterized protein n=1 Tax=Phaseolus angularis TaxID=3914 RepID=A0A0L9UDA1_PHAAN|nr:hypothetical protein LR48_Vigan04g111300 [Vigna angularis]
MVHLILSLTTHCIRTQLAKEESNVMIDRREKQRQREACGNLGPINSFTKKNGYMDDHALRKSLKLLLFFFTATDSTLAARHDEVTARASCSGAVSTRVQNSTFFLPPFSRATNLEGSSMALRSRRERGDGAVKTRRSLRGGVCCDGCFLRSHGGSCHGPQSNHEGGRGLGANDDDW